MIKNDSNYTLLNILWIFIKKIFYLIWVLFCGTLFYIIKFLYRILKLHRFEKIKDDAFLVKSDGLTHSFNFKRSPKFKSLYHDLQYELSMFHITVQCDMHNGTNHAEDKVDEMLEMVDKLIIEAEIEASSRAFNFSTRRRQNLPYTENNSSMMMDFFLENEMHRYSDTSNNLNEMKE